MTKYSYGCVLEAALAARSVPKLSSAFLDSGGNNGLAYCSDDYSVLAKSVRNAYQPDKGYGVASPALFRGRG